MNNMIMTPEGMQTYNEYEDDAEKRKMTKGSEVEGGLEGYEQMKGDVMMCKWYKYGPCLC